jgi:hypothetical protein
MAGGLAYYAQKPRFRPWQRLLGGIVWITFASYVGLYWEDLAQKRYSTFSGRTALYGSKTVKPGWVDPNLKNEEFE